MDGLCTVKSQALDSKAELSLLKAVQTKQVFGSDSQLELTRMVLAGEDIEPKRGEGLGASSVAAKALTDTFFQ